MKTPVVLPAGIALVLMLAPVSAFALLLQTDPVACTALKGIARTRCIRSASAEEKTGTPETLNEKLKIIMERRQLRRSDTSDHLFQSRKNADVQLQENMEKLNARHQEVLKGLKARLDEKKVRQEAKENEVMTQLRRRLGTFRKQSSMSKSDVRQHAIKIHDQAQRRRDALRNKREKCMALPINDRQNCVWNVLEEEEKEKSAGPGTAEEMSEE